MKEHQKVISIGSLELRQKWRERFAKKQCQHKRVELDPNGELVQCVDCSAYITPWYALCMLAEYWDEAAKRHEYREQKIKDTESQQVVLRAAQMAQSAWRRRKMVPTCPHCHRGIFTSDRFGSSMISKELEQRYREKCPKEH